VAFAGTSEGPLGGLFSAAMYAVPLLLLSRALTRARPGLDHIAGVVAIILALYFAAVPLGNWSGYSDLQAAFAVVITVPAVIVDLLIGSVGLRAPGRRCPHPHDRTLARSARGRPGILR
jgi:hypothetical protein